MVKTIEPIAYHMWLRRLNDQKKVADQILTDLFAQNAMAFDLMEATGETYISKETVWKAAELIMNLEQK